MMALRALPTASTAAPLRRVQQRALAVRVRAEAEQGSPAEAPVEAAAPAPAPAQASAPAPYMAAAPVAAVAAAGPPNAFAAMRIDAPIRSNVPFAVNARLAMIGVVASLGCEVFTHQSTLEQFSAHSTFVLALAGAITVASFAPVLRGASADEAFGPLTPRAERLNGEAAILGFLGLIIVELAKGSSLF